MDNVHFGIGSGVIGDLEHEMSEIDFLGLLKARFNANGIRHTTFRNRPIKKVAVCGGAGSFLVKKSIQQKADIYITSDIKYHEFFDAEDHLMIADIGHFESEQYTSEWLVAQMKKKFTNFAVRLTSVNTNPINYL